MKVNKASFREIKVVSFFEPNIMKWDPRKAPVLVKDIASNEMFTLYESQLRRIPAGKNDKGVDQAIWGYISEMRKK